MQSSHTMALLLLDSRQTRFLDIGRCKPRASRMNRRLAARDHSALF